MHENFFYLLCLTLNKSNTDKITTNILRFVTCAHTYTHTYMHTVCFKKFFTKQEISLHSSTPTIYRRGEERATSVSFLRGLR